MMDSLGYRFRAGGTEKPWEETGLFFESGQSVLVEDS